MNDSYNPKSKFSKFMAGKGFYIALDPHLHFAMKVAGKWADPLKTMGKVTE